MKKNSLLTTVLLLITLNSFSQKIKFGVIAGAGTSTSTRTNGTVNAADSSQSYTIKLQSIFSFHVGATAAIPINKDLIFKPQLGFITKGWATRHNNLDPSIADYTNKITSSWIELPLNVIYTIPGKNGRFFLGLGPYISCALSAKVHNGFSNSDIKFEFKKSDSENSRTANRMDYGANFLAGYELRNGLAISINYERGFRYFRNNLNNPSNKNIVFGGSLSYSFGNK